MPVMLNELPLLMITDLPVIGAITAHEALLGLAVVALWRRVVAREEQSRVDMREALEALHSTSRAAERSADAVTQLGEAVRDLTRVVHEQRTG